MQIAFLTNWFDWLSSTLGKSICHSTLAISHRCAAASSFSLLKRTMSLPLLRTLPLPLFSLKRKWEIKWSVSWFDYDELLTSWVLNSNSGRLGCFTFIFYSFGESCLLVSWYAGDRSRRPGAEDRGWSHRSGTRWPDDREAG
jgi:hypothetical protein